MTVFHKMNIKQMNKEIHYKCRCTGQRFTFKEWCNYLKGNPPKVVHTYKEFCFNIADMCLTPHIKIDWAKKVCFFKVTTAQSDNGRWDFGLSYNFWTQGGCCGATYIDTLKDGYNTEKEAVSAALNRVEENCQRVIDEILFRDGDPNDDDANKLETRGSSALPILKDTMNKIKSYRKLFNPCQLELF